MTKQVKDSTKNPPLGFWQKALLAVVGLVVLSAIFGDGDDVRVSHQTGTSEQALISSEDSPAVEPTVSITGPQRNALRTAESYIAMKGFSREGLIEQLSSEHGSGYEVADATFAVDSMNIDWNEQAAREAASYLEMMGFSCARLVDQLSSEHGAQYTLEQAKYGADKAGAC